MTTEGTCAIQDSPAVINRWVLSAVVRNLETKR